MANNNLRGYRIDFTTNTLVMNYKFDAQARKYGTAEYKLVKEILADFPTLERVVQAGREVKTTNKKKRLTYANMEKHIRVYENSDELLNIFEAVKLLSLTVASPYKFVSDWFVAQFPDYKNAPSFDDGKLYLLPVNAPDTKGYKPKADKTTNDDTEELDDAA